MAWKRSDNGNISYACQYCGSWDTQLISKMLVADDMSDIIEGSSRMAYYKLHSEHEYECNTCMLRFYIDENQRELINDRIKDGFDGEE